MKIFYLCGSYFKMKLDWCFDINIYLIKGPVKLYLMLSHTFQEVSQLNYHYYIRKFSLHIANKELWRFLKLCDCKFLFYSIYLNLLKSMQFIRIKICLFESSFRYIIWSYFKLFWVCLSLQNCFQFLIYLDMFERLKDCRESQQNRNNAQYLGSSKIFERWNMYPISNRVCKNWTGAPKRKDGYNMVHISQTMLDKANWCHVSWGTFQIQFSICIVFNVTSVNRLGKLDLSIPVLFCNWGHLTCRQGVDGFWPREPYQSLHLLWISYKFL